MKTRGRRLAGLLLACVLLALVVGLSADLVRQRGRVVRGVRVWGLPAGGQDGQQLASSLRGRQDLARPIAIAVDGHALQVVPAAAGIRLDTATTVAAAMAAGRDGGWWHRLVVEVTPWRAREAVTPTFTVDPRRWDSSLDGLAVLIDRLPRDAGLTLHKGTPTVSAARPGRNLDRTRLRMQLLEAVKAGDRRISAPLRTLAPRVTTAQAEAARAAAGAAFSRPIVLAYREARFSLSPEVLATMAEVNAAGVAAGRAITFDTPQGREILERLLSGLAVTPVDARFTVRGDGRGFDVIPGREGTVVEWDRLSASLDRMAFTGGRRVLPVPTASAQPRLSTEDAERLRTQREVASFTTYFDPSNEARAHNIQQVASLLNGTPVRPGSVFSFNQVVGPRTKAAGFDEAPVISNGRLTPGVGGGICQVSTTLFNAAFLAGLPIVERKPHSFYIDHYPLGRDATVSYGSTDFRFRNDSGQVLLVLAAATGRSVRVSLVAPTWDRTVTYTTGPVTNVVAPGSSAAEPRRLLDPTLAAGSQAPLEPGVDGRTLTVQRTVRDAKGALILQDSFRSVYRPKDYLVRVGPAG